MQTLQFKTNYDTVILSDLGRSSINEEKVPIVLYSFDPNSLSISTDTVKCIEMAGQHTVSTTVNPRTLTVTVTYNGIKDGRDTEAAMYALRRKLLKVFRLGEKGELAYTNSNGTYYLDVYPAEYPVIERTTGTLCKATLYFTADYPYWHQTVEDEPIEIAAGKSRRIRPVLKGDVLSPMQIEVRCVEEITGKSPEEPYFTLWLDGAANEQIRLVKALEVNQSILCSTGLNNEVYAKLLTYLNDTVYTSVNGSNYVDFNISNSPELYPYYEWVFSAGGTSGKFLINVLYQNIFLAV